MSVQRWTTTLSEARYRMDDGPFVLYADHARIVAEATAEARAAERRHWEARFRNAEQAHAAALAEERQRVLSMRFTEFMAAIKKSCPCICHEYTRDINPHDGKCVCNGGDGMETLGVAAPRTLTADDPLQAVVLHVAAELVRHQGMADERPDQVDPFLRAMATQLKGALDRSRALIHDGEDR